MHAGELRPECALANAALVADVLVLAAAAHKALAAAARGGLRTRSLHSELVFNLSGSKHVREVLGLHAGTKPRLVCAARPSAGASPAASRCPDCRLQRRWGGTASTQTASTSWRRGSTQRQKRRRSWQGWRRARPHRSQVRARRVCPGWRAGLAAGARALLLASLPPNHACPPRPLSLPCAAADLAAVADAALLQKYLKVTAAELEVGSLADAQLMRIAGRDWL